MFCTGGVDGKGVCGGDSGGPTFQSDGDQFVIVGITSASLGAGCAQAGQYTVNTKISFYLDWIQGQIAQNGANFPLTASFWLVIVATILAVL
jgi:secreted trypsin-like serine protease